jgi:streptomycin 6-kinase
VATLLQTALDLHGEEGRAWVSSIPALLSDLGQRWSFEPQLAFPNLSYNYTAPVERRDGTQAVIKLSFPGEEGFSTEVAALKLFAGRGAVRLLEADLERGAILLERLLPGTPLFEEADDEQATRVIGDILSQLWRPAPGRHSFPTIADWAAGFVRLRHRYGGTTGPLPAGLVQTAERLFAELLSSAAEPALLHGDLHHGNVLAAQRQPWLAIDPKGVVGEPAYDTAAMLRNPLPVILTWPNLERVLSRRIDQLAEHLGLDRRRIHGWGIAQTVLSAVWSLEDHGRNWEPAIACAQVLSKIK